MLVELERIMKVDLHHLMNWSFMILLTKWKGYYEDKVS